MTIPTQVFQVAKVLQPSTTAALVPSGKLLYFHPVSPLVQKIQNMKKTPKIGFSVPPTPRSMPAIYRQRRAAQWQQLHLLLVGSLHTQPLAQLLQLAGQQEQQPGGDTRVRR